jgi:hypothetical protein
MRHTRCHANLRDDEGTRTTTQATDELNDEKDSH